MTIRLQTISSVDIGSCTERCYLESERVVKPFSKGRRAMAVFDVGVHDGRMTNFHEQEHSFPGDAPSIT